MDKGDSGSPWEYVCGGCEWVCECVGGCVSVWVGVCVRGGGGVVRGRWEITVSTLEFRSCCR